jgi:phosphosulfolactate phosphohydrolase-like enzyme
VLPGSSFGAGAVVVVGARGGVVVVEGAVVVEAAVEGTAAAGAIVAALVGEEAPGGEPAAREPVAGEFEDDRQDEATNARVMTPTKSPAVFVGPSPLLSPLLVIGPLSSDSSETPRR